MSDREKRTPISIYLTPRASVILRQYSMGSGYGSVSRTVEEIILAFDSTHDTIKEALKVLISKTKDSQDRLSPSEMATLWPFVILVLTNIDNAVSRLNKEVPLTRKAT